MILFTLTPARDRSPTSKRRAARRQDGFTLVELLIAIAILAIVMGIAIPSYTQYVVESNRTEAHTALLGTAQTLERCFTRFSAYDDGDCPVQDGDTELTSGGKYEISVTAGATTYDLTAAPQGSQTKDTDCGSFTLDETGQRGISASSDPDDIAECW